MTTHADSASRRAGRASCVTCIAPIRLTSRKRWIMSGSHSSRGLMSKIPALLTRRSISPPKKSTARKTAASIEPWSRRLHWAAMASPPLASISSTTLSSSADVRAATQILTPG